MEKVVQAIKAWAEEK